MTESISACSVCVSIHTTLSMCQRLSTTSARWLAEQRWRLVYMTDIKATIERLKSTRVCVTGGSLFKDFEMLFFAMDELHKRFNFVEVWHGDCPTGADRFADEWAEDHGI